MRWDPDQYRRFAADRARPFFDLVGRIDAAAPKSVVDLGCGPGELTETLARRWPQAQVRGIDASPEMIARAPADGSVRFSVADANAFEATGVDVLVSNAMLQWIPGHRELIIRWAGELGPGAWLAFQVPANFDAPSHVLMRELAAEPGWRARLDGVARDTAASAPPVEYLALLSAAGMVVDAWQTEYLHVLPGPDPVLEWLRGTGLRPLLQALEPPDADRFADELALRLREAYPPQPYGTVLPFLRTFVVGHRPG